MGKGLAPIISESSFLVDLPTDRANQAMRELIEQMEGTLVTETPSTLEATFGSRMALRLLGIYTNKGRSRLPWKLTYTFDAAHSTAHLSAQSDEGFMIARVPKLTEEYNRILPAKLKEVRDRLKRPE